MAAINKVNLHNLNDKIIGKSITYSKKNVLGSGSFGCVIKVVNESTQEEFACKTVAKSTIECRKTFKTNQEREIRVHSSVKNEHIVDFIDHFSDDSHIFIVLGFCANGSISDEIDKKSVLSKRECRLYTRQILLGLKYLHDHEILHRDIKPCNILLDQHFIVKIADFGFSIKFDDPELLSTRPQLCGTLQYMAPEIISYRFYTIVSDVWAVGVTAFVMLCGDVPFGGLNPRQMYQRIHKFKLEINGYIDAELLFFLGKLLNKDEISRLSAEECLNLPFMMP